MNVKDLPAPVTASKADWLAGTTWLGFTPVDGTINARNSCQGTIQRQFGRGYVIEYITESFSEPNLGFERDPLYLQERESHRELAGRFIAVHRLRTTSRPLIDILGPAEFSHLQDVWAQGGKRYRWSVAFPIIESYHIVERPKAKEVLGEAGYYRLYAHSSATLRPLNDAERSALGDLPLKEVTAKNAWIGIEDEFPKAELSEIDPRTMRAIDVDLPDQALEGMTAERRAKIRRRAAWIADRFVRERREQNRMVCDDCGFDPIKHFDPKLVSPRSLLDVHHRNPLQEGIRYTWINDFALLCPTCHRMEHVKLRLLRTHSPTLAGS